MHWESTEASAAAALLSGSRANRIRTAWRKLQYVIGKLADGGPLVPLIVPVSPRLRRILKSYVTTGADSPECF